MRRILRFLAVSLTFLFGLAGPASAAPYVEEWRDASRDASAPADILSVRVTTTYDTLAILVKVRDLRPSGDLTAWVTSGRYGMKVRAVRSSSGLTLRFCSISYYEQGLVDRCSGAWRTMPRSRVEWRSDHNYVRFTLNRRDVWGTWRGWIFETTGEVSGVEKVTMRAFGAADGTLKPCEWCR